MPHTYTSASPPPQRDTSPSPCAPTPTSISPTRLTPDSSTTSLPSVANSKPKPKPVNIFTNDGSFLERIQRGKMV
ncbi:hypothetical protein P691DRAFT_808785 [Macrolepiota fuliginosa MF-IS2]|uniref:Uncharacterized protein n=1 Tax=Macrolepiota fuliginosa MF-IS2 TaxID=1400762 RepID=A0A9P5XGT0_9AGAR|nr:hypothetical protein P691DRAFT_808785 [Macrolepiota fuliginosa MF-IS2]